MLGDPGWPQVLRYRRRRRTAVRRVPAYRERWAPTPPPAAGSTPTPGSGHRAPGADEVEFLSRPWMFLPLGTDLADLPPAPPSAEGLLSAVALTGSLPLRAAVLECRAQWRAPARGRFRRDVRAVTLIDRDAPGDPERVSILRRSVLAATETAAVVLVGSAAQLASALDESTLRHDRVRAVRRLTVTDLAGPGYPTQPEAPVAAVVHSPALGYLAGRADGCGHLHVDSSRLYLRDGRDGVYATVLCGAGPVRLDVYIPGPSVVPCPQHGGPVLTR